MHPALAPSALALGLAACAAPDAPRFERSVAGGRLVRVVDAGGRPVAGAEVRVPRGAADPATFPDFLLAGSVGRADRFGATWITDERGEVRVPAYESEDTVVASRGDLWGSTLLPDDGQRDGAPARTIVVERDESIAISCADREGRPGVGSLVWIGVRAPRDEDGPASRGIAWGSIVTAADGTLAVPHAQHWRALQRAGREVTIAAFVLWGEELDANRSAPFPAAEDGPLRFETSPSGWIDVHADASTAGALGDLRWLDPPPDPADPDDVPEFPIAFPRGPAFSVPLGRRFEIAVSLPGLVDPRVAFAGPRSPGERVEVAIGRPEPVPRLTGRLVGEDGRALAGAEFEAWLEHEDARVLPEDDWLVADSDGRFAFDVPPGAGGVLRVELTGASVGPGFSYAFGIGADSARRRSARADLAPRLTAGTVDVGDLACRADP